MEETFMGLSDVVHCRLRLPAGPASMQAPPLCRPRLRPGPTSVQAPPPYRPRLCVVDQLELLHVQHLPLTGSNTNTSTRKLPSSTLNLPFQDIPALVILLTLPPPPILSSSPLHPPILSSSPPAPPLLWGVRRRGWGEGRGVRVLLHGVERVWSEQCAAHLIRRTEDLPEALL